MASTDVQKTLTPQQMEAAYFMAQGLGRKEIIAKMKDPVSEKSISNWRGDPAFMAEVELFKASTREGLEAVIVSSQFEAISGLSAKAKQVLIDALDAEDDEGNPLLALRMRAAELFYTKILPRVEAAQAKAEGGAGQGAAVIVINMPDTPGAAPQIVSGEVVDGEVVG